LRSEINLCIIKVRRKKGKFYLDLFSWSICIEYKCLGILPILGKVATDTFMVKLQDSRQYHMQLESRAEVYGIWFAILYL
jgi:hypothetical protein